MVLTVDHTTWQNLRHPDISYKLRHAYQFTYKGQESNPSLYWLYVCVCTCVCAFGCPPDYAVYTMRPAF